MAKIFKTNFDSYVCHGESITATYRGFTLRAIVEHDAHMGEPWKEHDGHGPVSEWTTRAKKPGERILSKDGQHKRYYDFQEAVKLARRDGWDCAPYARSVPGDISTPGWIANRAAEHDFKMLKAWCNDEWTWCGVCVEVSKNGVVLSEKYANATWGIECNYPVNSGETPNTYLADVANELASDALDNARKALADLSRTPVGKVLVKARKAMADARAALRSTRARSTKVGG